MTKQLVCRRSCQLAYLRLLAPSVGRGHGRRAFASNAAMLGLAYQLDSLPIGANFPQYPVLMRAEIVDFSRTSFSHPHDKVASLPALIISAAKLRSLLALLVMLMMQPVDRGDGHHCNETASGNAGDAGVGISASRARYWS